MQVLTAGLCASVIFLVLDGLWLGVIAKGFYVRQLGALMRPKFLLVPAVLFYLLIIAALLWFAILPAAQTGDWRAAALNGGILGLAAYGTYDLTNLATMKDFPAPLAAVDMMWGAILSAATSAGAMILLGLFGF